MHRKMPKFQLAHAGFLAPQSAHCELPGRESRSCNSRSFRCCSRLLGAAMLKPTLIYGKLVNEDMRRCGTSNSTKAVFSKPTSR